MGVKMAGSVGERDHSGGQASIAVGVTGHRLERLAGFDLPALEARIAEVLAAIEAAAPGTPFRLVGSLAEGADTLTAHAALARGWRIDAVLPFPREDYATDFEQAAAAEQFHALLDGSAKVFELPGDRDEVDGAAAAYERAGRVMLAQCELLVAVWDGDPPRGRGGAPQIAVEAVGQGVPVLTIHPDADRPPVLFWSGLNAHQFGLESIDAVARGGLEDLPALLAALTAGSRLPDRPARSVRSRWPARHIVALAYPLLLAITGVRALRRADFTGPNPSDPFTSPDDATAMDRRIDRALKPRFDDADRAASVAAQFFRSAFVSNFALAAIAVTLSLLGLVVPIKLKPLLVIGEFASITTILAITHGGVRAGWHRRWLDQRRLAEHLRCLAVSAQLGELLLRDAGAEDDITGQSRAIARSLGLPSARVDKEYLTDAHRSLVELLDDQIGYLKREAHRMHLLEHRLHRIGGMLFSTTAAICVCVLLIEGFNTLFPHLLGDWAHHLPLGITVVSAALPAIGAAIYGIRMQGDFSGVAERNTALAAQLIQLRRISEEDSDPASFDTLRRLVRHTAELLTQDVSQWFRASLARPLALPG